MLIPRWPDFYAVEDLFEEYKEQVIPMPSIDVPEEEFAKAAHQRWAVDDLLNYMYGFWFYDIPDEIIEDYIEDCKYRAIKYRDYPMGPVYKIAAETASDILNYFVTA